MFKIDSPKGEWEIEKFFKKAMNGRYEHQFDSYGKMGVDALSVASPVDSGLLSESWGYTITTNPGSIEIAWTNSDIENGACVAILVQYGHGCQNGGYIKGVDYINPAMKPVFDNIISQVLKEVS